MDDRKMNGAGGDVMEQRAADFLAELQALCGDEGDRSQEDPGGYITEETCGCEFCDRTDAVLDVVPTTGATAAMCIDCYDMLLLMVRDREAARDQELLHDWIADGF